jgi:uncharacterized protein (TIGR03118 family)
MPLVVGVPNAPTGAVGNAGSSFLVGGAAARFIFSTEEGKILAWQSGLGTQAQVVADLHDGAIYKGLALADGRLYATDFHNGRVDVFDNSFGFVPLPGAFVDPGIPRGFGPFGIQEIGGDIYVSYAKQDAAAGGRPPRSELGLRRSIRHRRRLPRPRRDPRATRCAVGPRPRA